jgi:DNA primase small subunit
MSTITLNSVINEKKFWTQLRGARKRKQKMSMSDRDPEPEVDLDALLGPRKSDIKLVYSDIVVARPANASLSVLPPPKDKEEEDKKQVVRFVGRGATQSSLPVTSTKRPPIDRETLNRERQERKRQRELEKLNEEQRAEEKLREEAMVAQALVAEAMYKKRKQMEEQYIRDHAVVHTGVENPEGFSVADHKLPEWKDGVNLDEADKRCDLTRYYGSAAFPLATIVKLATRNHRVPLENVEFGFVINDSFWRNKRFGSGQQLREFLAQMKPQRLELGPVHPCALKTQEPYANLPLQKFLVFDCDMQDVNDKHPHAYVRRCACKGAARVCAEGCWFYMRVAIKCLTYVLKQVLGCRTIVPVYSGRRGVHIWVLDEQFVSRSEEERTAIVKRIKLMGKPWKYAHPEFGAYIYDFILKDAFYANFLAGPRIVCAPEVPNIITDMVRGKRMKNSDNNNNGTLVLPDEVIEALVRVQMEAENKNAWGEFCARMNVIVPDFERQFIYRMMYPRLDEDVTVKHHHLVKFPFVVHPGSRRCSIPIPDVDTWTPDMAPRLSELMAYAAQFEDMAAVMEEQANKRRNRKKQEVERNPYGWRDPRRYHQEDGGGAARDKANPIDPYEMHFAKMLAAEYPLMDTFLK